MNDKHSGSCLCNAVRFAVRGGFESFFLCHCRYCQKDSGSAHAANLFSTTAEIDWITGENEVTNFVLPSTRHARSFCKTCGSAVPSLQMDGKLLVVPAGCLDTDLDAVPDAHIFESSRASWDNALGEVAGFAGLPPEAR